MAVVISWTKSWSSSDDGTVLGGADLGNIQTDVAGHSHSGLATLLSELNDISISSVAQGDILYRGASLWNNLVAGTAGNTLKSGGASANPSWVALNLAGGSAYVTGELPNANLATISTAGKVSGAALTSLSSIPSGAGQIPSANLGTGKVVVVTYTGTGADGLTVAHTFGATPSVAIVINTNANGTNYIRHSSMSANQSRPLGGGNASTTEIKSFDGTNVTLGNGTNTNTNNDTYALITF